MRRWLIVAATVVMTGAIVGMVAGRQPPGIFAAASAAHGPMPSIDSGTRPVRTPSLTAPPQPSTVPAPFEQNFAHGAPTLAPLPSPTALHAVAAHIDGCDHNYGRPGQCVPWTFPPGTTDRCEWLLAHGLAALPVVGTDRLNLDANDDGIACGHVDA